MTNIDFLKMAETFNLIYSRLSAKTLGVPMEFTIEETEYIARNAKLEPIMDGTFWSPGLNLVEGTIIFYDGNYQVLQNHISQLNWAPPNTPALFKKIQEDFAEWEQPQGAHDAYMIGDKVSYQGFKWRSEVNSNIWAPDVYGWSKI